MPTTLLRNFTAPASFVRLGKSGIGLVILASLLAILAINRDAPLYTNADSLLFPIMSLQHVTMFYWGQNRIMNFVPLILSPIGSSEWSLLLHLFVFTTAFFLLIFLGGFWMFQRAFPTASPLQCRAFTAIFLLITISIIQPGALFEMSGSGDPYALSYLALVVAARWAMKRFGPVSILATFGGLVIAVGLNPSVVIPALFGSVMFAYFGYVRAAVLTAISSIIAFGAWLLLKQWAPAYPVPYFGIDLHHIDAALLASAQSIMSNLHLAVLAVFGIAFGALAFLQASLAVENRSYRRVFAALLAFGALWWLAFSVNSWVLQNTGLVRYFFPVVLILCALVALLAARQLLLWPQRLVSCIGLLCLVLALGALYAPPKPMANWAVFQRVDGYASYAREHDIRLIAGDYWAVWPTVFRLLDTRQSAFGLTARGNGNAEHLKMFLDSQLEQGRHPKGLCVNATADVCIEWAASITKLRWVPVSGACPGACSLMQVSD